MRGSASVTRKVPRKMFYPVPGVDSAVVRIDLQTALPEPLAKNYRAVVRAAFLSRRKTLCNNLMQTFSLSRAQAEEALAAANLPLMCRGETLSAEQFLALAQKLFSESTREVPVRNSVAAAEAYNIKTAEKR